MEDRGVPMHLANYPRGGCKPIEDADRGQHQGERGQDVPYRRRGEGSRVRRVVPVPPRVNGCTNGRGMLAKKEWCSYRRPFARINPTAGASRSRTSIEDNIKENEDNIFHIEGGAKGTACAVSCRCLRAWMVAQMDGGCSRKRSGVLTGPSTPPTFHVNRELLM